MWLVISDKARRQRESPVLLDANVKALRISTPECSIVLNERHMIASDFSEIFEPNTIAAFVQSCNKGPRTVMRSSRQTFDRCRPLRLAGAGGRRPHLRDDCRVQRAPALREPGHIPDPIPGTRRFWRPSLRRGDQRPRQVLSSAVPPFRPSVGSSRWKSMVGRSDVCGCDPSPVFGRESHPAASTSRGVFSTSISIGVSQ